MRKESDLVAKAKAKKTRKSASVRRPEIQLAMAWLNDEVTSAQVVHALGCKTRSYSKLYRIAIALKAAYQQGVLVSPRKELDKRLAGRKKPKLDPRDIGAPACEEEQPNGQG